jgi:hypothetical protein
MRIKTLIIVLLGSFIAAFGCNAGQPADQITANGYHSRHITYPPQSALEYPQDQVVKKEFEITTQWQTITFEKPLQINRHGLMGLHLAVDQAPYISTTDDDPRNLDCSDAEYQKNAFSLRRRSDGVLVRPEAILVGDNGVEVKVRPDGHLYPYSDKSIMTMALRTFKDVNSPSPPFPKGIKSITAMRIRSTAPFLVRYIYWNVDRYPFYD